MVSQVLNRKTLGQARAIVIKIGSALLTNDGQGLDTERVASWVDQFIALRQSGIHPIIVSSGAVAAGMARLGWSRRPTELSELQAAAAIGQSALVRCWEDQFAAHSVMSAQMLLTHDDLSNRKRYLNARSTLNSLVNLDVVPIINENDSVVNDEIRFGDNDTLAALVANLIEAEAVILLTDQEGLFTADPRSNPEATLIDEADADDPSLDAIAGGGGKLGRGGMATKLRASRLAARSGAVTFIASGRQPQVITRLVKGEVLGTLLKPEHAPMTARKQWIAGHLQSHGELILDWGAVERLVKHGSSLLPVGVTHITGTFKRGDLVHCLDPNGHVIAKGLVNYEAEEASRIMGHSSAEIEALLGFVESPDLVHRDNLVVL